MTIHVGLAQISPKLGDFSANLALHLDSLEQAKARGVQLLIFPELSLTGYRLRDLTAEVAINPYSADSPLAPLLLKTLIDDIDIVIGFAEEDDRHRHTISAAYCSQGEIRHIHRKIYLANYGMFEESRYFGAGDRVRAFDTRWGRMGICICEDFWHLSTPYLLWNDGAEILIMCSASPGRGIVQEQLSSAEWVERINQSYASAFTNFVLHCNRVGIEDGVNFWGGSFICGPLGEKIAQAPYHDPALLTATLDLAQLRRARVRLPLLRDERPDLVLRELTRLAQQEP